MSAPMSWAVGVDVALLRGGSPYRFGDWFKWLCAGEVVFAAGDRMQASVWFRDGGAEVAHVSGEWNLTDARWLRDCLKRELAARGVAGCEINGRKGWPRFLEGLK